MSRKSLKHSEQKKLSFASRMKGSWGKGRASAPVIPIRPERYLIVTEGTETEPNYFKEIRRRINDNYHGKYVTVDVRGQGMNTMLLFERAKRIAERHPDGFSQVWVVYDKDSFPASSFNAVVEQCDGASGDGVSYRAAWSNESFELWFVLHFRYMQSALGRHDYARMLSSMMKENGMGPYRKNRDDMFAALEPLLPNTFRNAKKLEKANMGSSPSDANPGTAVHHLVEELLPYVKVKHEK